MVGTPRSDCAGCFIVYLAKKIVNFTKNQLFFEKKVEKICVYQKKFVHLHSKTKGSIGLQAFTERIRQ